MPWLDQKAAYLLLREKAHKLAEAKRAYFEQNESVWLVEKAARIREKARKLAEAEQAYFEEFPASFGVFNDLFGYRYEGEWGGDYKPGILCREPYNNMAIHPNFIDYIDAFWRLSSSSIAKKTFYNRLIDIGRQGKWDADAVNIFLHELRELVLNDLAYFCKLLSQRDQVTMSGFWFFYFDGPHPPKSIPDELQKVKTINASMYTLMEKALHQTHKGACQGH